MLYDPKWEVQTDVFSLESLIAWLEKRPAGKCYDYMGCDGGCLLNQYFRARGFPTAEAGGTIIWLDKDRPGTPLPEVWQDIAHDEPHTFGAALERARKAIV